MIFDEKSSFFVYMLILIVFDPTLMLWSLSAWISLIHLFGQEFESHDQLSDLFRRGFES